MLSEMDKNILEILSADCRVSNAHIAAMVGADESAVASAIARLERAKILVKYPAMINWDKAEVERVEAVIEVRVTPQRDQGFDAIAARIYRFDEVRSVSLMSGSYDLLVVMEAGSMRRLAFFVAEKLSTLDSVLSTATHFVLKKYKTEGVIMEEPLTEKRQAVTA